MGKEDKLYALIQSMSMSEKRYFDLYASRHVIGGYNHYKLLFDALAEMPQYDRQSLEAHLKDKDVSIDHLSSEKTYLYRLLLKSLAAYHQERTASQTVKNLLVQAEVLYLRGLYRQCKKILGKAYKTALRHELFPLLLEVMQWERKVAGQLADFDGMSQVMGAISRYQAVLENLLSYQRLYDQMAGMLLQHRKARSNETVAALQQLVSDPLLQHEDRAQSSQARLYFWRIYAMYHFVLDEREKELAANDRVKSLMEEDPVHLSEYPGTYVNVFSRILNLQRKAAEQDFGALLASFHQLAERLKGDRPDLAMRIQASAASVAVVRLIELDRWEEAHKHLPKLEALMEEYGRKMPAAQQCTFAYLFAYVNLINGRHNEALNHINYILNTFDPGVRPDLHTATRLINLALHVELDNLDLVRRFADTSLRHLKKQGRLFRLEETLLRFFRRLAKLKEEKARLQALRDIREEVERITVDGYERIALDYFDILRWIDTQIRRLQAAGIG
jgi:hypothetical protein